MKEVIILFRFIFNFRFYSALLYILPYLFYVLPGRRIRKEEDLELFNNTKVKKLKNIIYIIRFVGSILTIMKGF